MNIKHIENLLIPSILKNNLYLNGIIVSDKIFDLLKSSQYDGYRTTVGLFMKLGGTLSKQEFENLKLNNNRNTLLSEIPKTLSYEDYLKIREYATVSLKKASLVDKENLKDKTYFILDTAKNGKLNIIGQYVYKNNIYPIKIDDCGVFKQDNYKDEDVVLQAGGIRLRASICGDNCISGCKFCDYSKGSENYIENTLTTERKEHITNLVKQSTLSTRVQTLFITGGNPSLADMHKWTEFVEESINTFKKSVPNGSVDIMLTPRGFDQYVYADTTRYEEYKKYLEYLKSIGADRISPNMELWEQTDLNKFCSVNNTKLNIGTTKSEIGHNGYMDFIKAGIEVFGKFNVRTSLIVGLNSNDSIRKAIKDLIPSGCYVVISPFKAPNEHLNQLEPSDYDLIELSNYLKYETDIVLDSLPTNLKQTYEERISNSLNAHNSHNTSNLCCGQNLDFIEYQALSLGKDNHIVSNIGDDEIIL